MPHHSGSRLICLFAGALISHVRISRSPAEAGDQLRPPRLRVAARSGRRHANIDEVLYGPGHADAGIVYVRNSEPAPRVRTFPRGNRRKRRSGATPLRQP